MASEWPVQEHFDKKVLDTTGGSVLFLTSIKISEWKCFLALGHTADLATSSLKYEKVRFQGKKGNYHGNKFIQFFAI